MTTQKNPLYCSFCGKAQHETAKLIAGPSVFICDECVSLCNEIIHQVDSDLNHLLVKNDTTSLKRVGGTDIAHVRLKCFELLKDHGVTGSDGHFRRWDMNEKMVQAERLAEWALAQSLTCIHEIKAPECADKPGHGAIG